MTRELRIWLWKRWMKDNPMNLKYFGLWIQSLDKNQIEQFKAQFDGEKRNK